ncbi:MAG: HPr family phosphocarrier protein [Chitinivibrionales bacterium]|nr:HPr family phosphocarrier protein [Chitinivibrionales bacterium]
MKNQEVIVRNRLGIHARPAAMIVQCASRFNSEIWLEKDGMKANAKSIMSVMMLAAAADTTLCIMAAGKDEETALAAIVDLFSKKFNEE